MYTHIWNKYLPVIRILLKKSAAEEQKMGLNRTDFEKGNRTRKPACSFNIELEKGRFVTLSQSVPAKDLVAALMVDDVSKALLKQNNYNISLNSDLLLCITNKTPVEAETAETE
ncbi:MAG: hypothetical protein ACXWV6_11465 [Chitinophagaceae bacterium]